MAQEQKQINFSEIYQLQPKQMDFLNAIKDYRYVLGGGAAGGGKSHAIRAAALYLCFYYATKYKIKGGRVGIFCEDYPAIKERHLSRIPYEYPDWLGTLNRSESQFALRPEYGEWIITFRNLDNPAKYLSSQWAAILVDELTMNTREVFEFLNMRTRWPGIPDTKFAACTNPGNKGHAWVKKLWIDNDFREETFNPNDFYFVPFKYSDNTFLDKSYEQTLNTLSPELRRAYKDGDWDIFAGQFFTEFRREIHTCDSFEIPKNWPRFIGLDYGWSSFSAVVWIAYDPAEGNYYVYRELYVSEKTYQDLARMIIKLNDGADIVYADPAIWAKKDSPKSGATEMEPILRAGGIRLDQGDNERINGWRIMRQPMQVKEGRTKFKIFRHCENTIRTLPAMVYKEGTEDMETKGVEDHLSDAIRYGIVSFENRPKQSKPIIVPYGGSTKYISSSDFDNEFESQNNEMMFKFD